MKQRFNLPNVVFLENKGRHRNILIMVLFAPQMQQLETETRHYVLWSGKVILRASDSFLDIH